MTNEKKDWEGRWVMTTHRVLGGIRVWIGSIQIATIAFVGPKGQKKSVVLRINSELIPVDSVSDALNMIHKYLKLPPPENQRSVG